MPSQEINYKVKFCEKYFDAKYCQYDINYVDIILNDKKGAPLLYIESKDLITNEQLHRQAIAQIILTNKKQKSILGKVALIFKDEDGNDNLELIDCSDNSVMFNNDFNWNAERPSSPTKDAIDRINDRVKGKITSFKNDEIREFYKLLKSNRETIISITENNFNIVYNQWKNAVKFKREIQDEQELINLYLVDILNGTTYKKEVKDLIFSEDELIREGTNLSKYSLLPQNTEFRERIEYNEEQIFKFADSQVYADFWKKYKRPPEKNEFLKILERSATLYSEKYRKDTGGFYTPTCFVELQNEKLEEIYGSDWKEKFIVCDTCAGVGNLENQFGKEFKQFCYLSTLEQTDVDICKIKGFENVVQFDYLKNLEQPKWKYKGEMLDITEICKRENRKLMIVMNPPYVYQKGFDNNLAIEFFNKCLKLNPAVIVFYYMTESFLRSEIEHYIKSGYKIQSHIFSSAEKTFQIKNWPISQVIFDKEKGEEIDESAIKADRYELNKKTGQLELIKTYVYNNSLPNLFLELKKTIKNNEKGLVLGNVSYTHSCINLTNKDAKNSNNFTTNNLKYCLLSKGFCFNTDAKYFEWNDYVYKGKIEDIPQELFNDAIMFSLFYIGMAFINKGQRNFIMPFTAEQLGCAKNDLNVLFEDEKQIKIDLEQNSDKPKQEPPFDFREWFSQFKFSKEAEDLFQAALAIFRFYHKNEEFAKGRDWNDSFYDITNAIMGKDATNFSTLELENDKRITKTKTTKGTRGFGRNTIKYAVSSEHLPIFTAFFDARDVLARKINRQLVDAGLLLWERENIY